VGHCRRGGPASEFSPEHDNFATHERLVRDLTAQTGATFVFVNYTPSPETHYPAALEQVYATAKWVAR
jgi:acetyl esterase/lipase